jgi:purine-cytosine permease-like protein
MIIENNIKDNHRYKITDLKQSWWQLAAIQLAGVSSLPILTGSILIIQNSNFLSAILSLILANILLWLIRVLVVNMSFKKRKSAIDISRDYFGNFGSYFIAILLLLSTFAWFIMQTTLASNSLNYLIPIEENLGINRFVQMGILIGILSTLFCMNGIKMIKWVSVIAFPLLFIAFIGIFFTANPSLPSKTVSGISLSGIPIILTTNLGITVDIPTFFRHSNSKKDSINAITLIQILSFLIGIGGLFLSFIVEPWFGITTNNKLLLNNFLLKNFLIIFIFISAICANISNVYSSSVGWELIAPILAGRKEYLILGLSLTMGFILIAKIFSLELLANLTDYSLINLTFVLIIGYLWYLIVKRSPNSQEKFSYFIAWIIATIINILQLFNIMLKDISPLIIGVISIVLTILVLLPIINLFKRIK